MMKAGAGVGAGTGAGPTADASLEERWSELMGKKAGGTLT